MTNLIDLYTIMLGLEIECKLEGLSWNVNSTDHISSAMYNKDSKNDSSQENIHKMNYRKVICEKKGDVEMFHSWKQLPMIVQAAFGPPKFSRSVVQLYYRGRNFAHGISRIML